MRLALLVMVLGCGSSSAPVSAPRAPAAVAVAAPSTAPVAPTPPPPPRIEPAGSDGAEVLVADIERPTQLVVFDDHLYWRGADGIYHAPHQRDTKPARLAAAASGFSMAAVGDQLVWEEDWALRTIPRTGGEPRKLVEIAMAVRTILDAGGLVVGAWSAGGDRDESRVYRVTDSGGVTTIAKLTGEMPDLAVSPRGELFVATMANEWTKKRAVLGRIVDEKFVRWPAPAGAKVIVATDDGLYCVVTKSFEDSIVKVVDGATKPATITKAQSGSMTALVADDTHLYWAEYAPPDGGKIWRVAKAGGKPEALASVGETTRLVIYGPDLYWADTRKNLIARVRR